MDKKEKPSWENAPLWAKWLAQDYHGNWSWFRNKPRIEQKHIEKRKEK